MKRILFTALPLLAVLLASACSKESEKSLYDKQEEIIERFIQARADAGETEVVYNNGSARIIVQPGEGTPLSATGSLSFYFAGYLLTGSSISNAALFWTNRKETAESARWSVTDSTVFTVETRSLRDDALLPGLKDGLTGVQKGEECYIAFSGKHGYGKKLHGTISAKSALVYHIWVEDTANE